MISLYEVDFFRRSGYLKYEGVFSREEVQLLKDLVLNHCQRKIVPCLEDDLGRVYRLNQLFDREKLFRKALTNKAILDILEPLIGPNIEFVKNRHNHATVNTARDTKFRLHRDVLQWSRNIVSVIVYLDDATVDSGATYIIPCSQYLPFVGTPNNGGTWMDEHHVFAALLQQAVQIEVASGGILVFDSLAFHSVGPNKGLGTRVSIAAGYTSVDELVTIEDNTLREVVRGERLYRGTIQPGDER